MIPLLAAERIYGRIVPSFGTSGLKEKMKLAKSTVNGGGRKFALLLACVSALGAFGDNDPYIQSDGANTVNLGYFASGKTKVEVDFQFVELVKNYDTVFGHYGNNLTFLLYAPLSDSLTGKFSFSVKDGDYVGAGFSPTVSIDLARHKVVFDAPNRHAAMYAADGTLEGEADFPSGWTLQNTSNWPLLLFGSSVNPNGSARSGRCAKVRIYGAKIYETDNGQQSLVHDLVPCLKGENAGLYDNVTATFFGGHGSSGGLVAGGEGIMTISEDGYVESPADNYASKHLTFNTGYYMKSNSWLAVDFQWLGTPKDLLFGAWDTDAKLSVGFWINSGFSFLFKPVGGYRTFPSSIAADNYRHVAIIDARNASFRLLNRSGFVQYSGVDGTGDNPGNAVAEWPIVLFGAASNANGTGKQWSYARIFSAKFYEGDNPNPVKEFIPFASHGVVGFKETVSGTFYPTTGMSGGGAIASNGRADAYVESSGSTCLNLGYKANMKSRIEVDFLSLGSTSKCLCGAWSGGDLRYTFGSTSASKWSFIFHGKNTADPQYGTGLDEDRERHTVVMDMKNQQMSVVTGGVTNWTKTATAGTFNATDESSYPMGLFGHVNNASGTSSEMLAKARVYSVRIYEDDVLKHEFLPCKDGATVSLYDTVDKTCAAKVKDSYPWPGIGGKGVEGVERWLVEPQDTTLKVNGSVTLKALAAGAISYKWTCNGEAVAGGTDGELAVEWRMADAPDVYAVTPVYSVLGVATDGTAIATATVTHLPRGLIISIR